MEYASPDTAALYLRQNWGLGERPIPNMLKLLEAKGVRVFSLAENTKAVDAFSVWRNGLPYVFLNIAKSAERSRFDASHELGHLVMHKHGGGLDLGPGSGSDDHGLGKLSNQGGHIRAGSPKTRQTNLPRHS
jgi:hypothetical protein